MIFRAHRPPHRPPHRAPHRAPAPVTYRAGVTTTARPSSPGDDGEPGGRPPTRRAVLGAGLAGAGAAALAGCAAGSAAGGSGASSGPTATGPTTGTPVARLADIAVGQALPVRLAGGDVLVTRPTATTARCFSAICTHQGCTVQPAGARFVCPCHGSVYDARTGAVLRGPAPAPLPQIPVRVRDGEVVTA